VGSSRARLGGSVRGRDAVVWIPNRIPLSSQRLVRLETDTEERAPEIEAYHQLVAQ
jgi:hypothetical protein